MGEPRHGLQGVQPPQGRPDPRRGADPADAPPVRAAERRLLALHAVPCRRAQRAHGGATSSWARTDGRRAAAEGVGPRSARGAGAPRGHPGRSPLDRAGASRRRPRSVPRGRLRARPRARRRTARLGRRHRRAAGPPACPVPGCPLREPLRDGGGAAPGRSARSHDLSPRRHLLRPPPTGRRHLRRHARRGPRAARLHRERPRHLARCRRRAGSGRRSVRRPRRPRGRDAAGGRRPAHSLPGGRPPDAARRPLRRHAGVRRGARDPGCDHRRGGARSPRLRGADLRRARPAARSGAAVGGPAPCGGDRPPGGRRARARSPARHPAGEGRRRGSLGPHVPHG